MCQLALFFLIYYLIFRIVHWPSYLRGLSIVGSAVPALWGPLMVRFWQRRTAALAHKWQLHEVPESE